MGHDALSEKNFSTVQYQFNGYSSNIESNIFLTFHRQIEIPVLSKERDLVSNFFLLFIEQFLKEFLKL